MLKPLLGLSVDPGEQQTTLQVRACRAIAGIGGLGSIREGRVGWTVQRKAAVHPVVALRRRTFDVPAQAEVDRQAIGNPVIVLH